jgi:Putative peptidoglycan binding domain
MISPRFFGNDVLDACLAGHRMFNGSGDPPEAVALVQQALADLGFTIDVDGNFGSETGDVVSAFKSDQGITPSDPVVGPETMGALDIEFAHELIDNKANNVAGTRFDLGARIGTRDDTVEGFATCDFQSGICVESGHVAAYAMPATVQAAWLAAGGLTGAFGPPSGDPMVLDATRSAQDFTQVAFIFGGPQDFTLPLDAWEASTAGGALIGLPVAPQQSVGAAGATFAQHDKGVVLAAPEAPPQPLPQAVFDLWSAQETAGTSLGPPTAFSFPTPGGNTFPFLIGSITLTDAGVASIGGPVSADLQRYFQPGDIDAHLTPRLSGTKATSIIGATAAFASMRADIASASGPTDFVYILSWHCNIDLEMVTGDPTSTLRSLLADSASRGVQIRAILWAGDPVPAPPTIVKIITPPVAIPWELVKQFARTKTSRPVNEPAVVFLNSLRARGNDAAAILDDRHCKPGLTTRKSSS